MAARDDLDTGALLRCHKFNEALFQENLDNFTTLWDEYGIVADLVVGPFHSITLSSPLTAC